MRFLLVFAAASLGVLNAGASPTRAEDRAPFFPTNSVDAHFDDHIYENSYNELVFLEKPLAQIKAEEEEKKKEQKPKTEETPTKYSLSKELKTPEDIVKKFGSPDEREPVMAELNAPRPFQALRAALELGDDDLAFQYARKFMQFLKDSQDSGVRIRNMLGLAQQAIGVSDGQDWTASHELDSERPLLERELKRLDDLKKQYGDIDTLDVDEGARALIKQAREGKVDPLEGGLHKPEMPFDDFASLDEAGARKRARSDLAGNLPKDPKGEYDIGLFFKPTDLKAIGLGPEYEKFYKSAREDRRLNIMGFTLPGSSASDLTNFRNQTSVTFPVQDGAIEARALHIEQSPTIVFMSRNTGQVLKIKGSRPAAYLDEALKMIHGS